jgi:3-dehydroquinate synthase
VFIPTTLLSMVDSSVGGKLGVDLNCLKNQIGVFALPEHIFIDTAFIQTLPEVEILSGMAEVIKHACIGDRKLLKLLENQNCITDQDWEVLVRQSVAVKAKIAQRDPYERGFRRLLNFGHTVGHAIETLMLDKGTPITHGHAVAVGMYLELVNCVEPESRKVWQEKVLRIIEKHYDLSVLSNITHQEVWDTMQHDKKRSGNTLVIALPDSRLFTLTTYNWENPGQFQIAFGKDTMSLL